MPRRAADVLDDSEMDQMLFSPVCAYCKWWKPLDGHHCAAYPRPGNRQKETPKIPTDIWDGRDFHLTHRPGDHGITFVPDPSVVRTKTNARLLDAYAAKLAKEKQAK